MSYILQRVLAVLLFVVLAQSGVAESVDLKRFVIERGLVTDTLREFADQSGAEIIYMFDRIQGVETNRVEGEYTTEEALELLLAETPLVAVRVSGQDTFSIKRRAEKGGNEPDRSNDQQLQDTTTQTQMNLEKKRKPKTSKNVFKSLLSIALLGGANSGVAQENDEPYELETIVVRPLADQRNQAIQAKRESENIKDILSSDRLGQWVDEDIGDVVERVPGVYTSGAGQNGGAGISVRGLPGDFNSLQLDGNRLPSNQGQTRGVSIDNIPADLIGSIEISKAATPDMEADSIGGSVNVITKTGLDLDRTLVNGRWGYGFNDNANDGGAYQQASVNYASPINDKLGIFFSANLREEKSLRDEYRWDAGDFDSQDDYRIEPLGDVIEDDPFYWFDRTSARQTQQNQRNLGFSLNLDYRPDDNWTIGFRSFIADFEESRDQTRSRYRFDRSNGSDDFGEDDWVLIQDSVVYTGDESRIRKRVSTQDETEEIRQYQISSIHRGDNAELDVSLTYGQAKRDLVNEQYHFRSDKAQLFYDISDRLRPLVGVVPADSPFAYEGAPLPDLNDPASFDFDDDPQFEPRDRRSDVILGDDEIINYEVNYKRYLDGSGSETTYWKVGLKGRNQDKNNDRDFVIIDGGFDFDASVADFVEVNDWFDRFDLGVFPTIETLQTQNPMRHREWVQYTFDQGMWNASDVRGSTLQDIGLSEDVYAAYGMYSYTRDRWNVLGGVRYERTDATYQGFANDPVDIDSIFPTTGDRSYDGFYSSVHANYRLSDKSLLRFSAGQTLARPSFEALNPSTFVSLSEDEEEDETIVNLERGNFNLEPTESTNVDLAFEHYFEPAGIFSINLFYKELEDWVFESTEIFDPSAFPEFADIENLVQVNVDSRLNGETAEITGVELNLERDLFWGFSFGVNYTGMSMDVNEEEVGLDRVPGFAENLFYSQLAYENDWLTARLSWRETSEILDERFSNGNFVPVFGTNTIGEFDAESESLNFTVDVTLSKNVKFFTRFRNITGYDNLTYFNNDPDYAERSENRSWTGLVGLKFSL